MIKNPKDAAMHLRVSIELDTKLRELAKLRNIRLSVLMREALETYVKEVKDVEQI